MSSVIGPSESSNIRLISNSILDQIGSTPLVRLKKTAALHNLKCNLLVKCEFFNAGGSIKDRIALRMVEEAERTGRLIPGKSVVIEASSGNTGIGLALVCAVKGYRTIITMPEKMSLEKERTLLALGAEIIRTPTEAAHDSPYSNMGRAKSLVAEIPDGVMLDQYGNADNPLAHYYGTGSEIVDSIESTPGTIDCPTSSMKCDLLVAGAGTGGTLTGIAKRLRESNEQVIILGVDPVGSLIARPESLNVLKEGESDMYKVEGIGYDFIPDVLDHSRVDLWMKVDDTEAFKAARELIRSEGLLCGGSCGSAMSAALRYLTSPEGYAKIGGVEGKNVVVVLADSIRNYMSSEWLIEGGKTATR